MTYDLVVTHRLSGAELNRETFDDLYDAIGAANAVAATAYGPAEAAVIDTNGQPRFERAVD